MKLASSLEISQRFTKDSVTMRLLLSALTAVALTAGATIDSAPVQAIEIRLPIFRANPIANSFQIAQTSRAERTCIETVEDRGYDVEGILDTNEFSGGVEVVMEVRSSRENLVVGCDYATNTGEVELYRLEARENRYGNRNDDYNDHHNDNYDDRYNDNYDDDYNDRYNNDYDEDDWQARYYDSNGVRNEDDAEDIARAVVGDQLGIDDPYSRIVQIEDVRQESRDRDWVVEGTANGAPFVVRIRDQDAYIVGFDLY